MDVGNREVILGDLKFTIRYSTISLLKYLNAEKNDPVVLYHYFYDLCELGAKAAKEKFDYTFDEFVFAIDCYPEVIKTFQEAISSFGSSGDDGKKKLKR